MKRLMVVLVLAMVIATTGIAWGSTASDGPAHHPVPHSCTVQAFRPFSKAVWKLDRWERGVPPQKVLNAYRKRLGCAPIAHKKAMKATWHRDQSAYFEYRSKMLWYKKFRPFVYPDGKHWAVPYPIAWCESGGNYYVGPSGAYGLIPPFPQWLPPKKQDEIAYRLYLEQGEGPWAPYESGCAYR